jgi:hypothetical protein
LFDIYFNIDYSKFVIANATIVNALADLLINLSAGWVGAILISPNFTWASRNKKIIVLTTDVILATISLVLAVILKQSLI